MEHGNPPSKDRSAAHALITGDCDVECHCYLETPGLKRDTGHKRERVGNSLSILKQNDMTDTGRGW